MDGIASSETARAYALHLADAPSALTIAFAGTNIWVTNLNGASATKLLASRGAAVGTYPVGRSSEGLTFDGTNIWTANYGKPYYGASTTP